AFPFILLAIAVIGVLGPNLPVIIVVIGVSSWVVYARVVRGAVLSLREREFVQAAHALGSRDGRVLVHHIMPNAFTPWLVVATLDMARVIVIESALSFLGLGVQPPTPTWGGMLADGRVYISTAWWLATFPEVATDDGRGESAAGVLLQHLAGNLRARGPSAPRDSPPHRGPRDPPRLS